MIANYKGTLGKNVLKEKIEEHSVTAVVLTDTSVLWWQGEDRGKV